MRIGTVARCSRRSAACGARPQPPAPAGGPRRTARGRRAAPARDRASSMSEDLVHLEYHVLGRGEPAVLLVHGWCGQRELLARADRCPEEPATRWWRSNLAGHGASGANRTDWSIANYAARRRHDGAADPEPAARAGRALDGRRPWRWPRPHQASARGSSASSRWMRCARSACRRSAPGEIETRVAPFRADFIGATRSARDRLAVREGRRSAAGAEGGLRHVAALAGGGGADARRSCCRSTSRTLLPHVHVPVYAINSDLMPTDVTRISKSLPRLHPRRAAAHRPLPHAGSAAALQSAADEGYRGDRGARRH